MAMFRIIPALILCAAVFTVQDTIAKGQQIRVKFTSPHLPLDVTKHGADQFRKSLEKLTGGQATVDFTSYVDPKADVPDVLKDLHKGDFAVTQIYVSGMTDMFPQLNVFNVPFLFQSHEHVGAFINSPAGKGLLASFETGGLKALGFTYSGGERIIISDRRIEKYEDLAGLKYRIEPNEQHIMSHKYLDTKVAAYMPPENARLSRKGPLDMLDSKKINAGDAIYTDFWQVLSEKKQKAPYVINEAGTGYLLSVIVMDLKYFNKLPPAIQTAVVRAGADAATAERNYAIQQEHKTAALAIAAGWEIYKMSYPERERFKEVLFPVIDMMNKRSGTALIKSVNAAKPSGATLSKAD